MSTVGSARSSISSVLKPTGIHARLKNSYLRDVYWALGKRQFLDRRRREIEFYRDLLQGFRKGDVVFDVGANNGTKTDVFIRLGARVVAIEPDEQNQEILRGKFIQYRWSPKPVRIVGKALSEKVSIETMWIDGPGSALNTLSRKWVDALKGNKERFAHTTDPLEFANSKSIPTTTLDRLSAEYGLPFFVKIDVEGHELSVLKGLQQPVPFLSYEINLPEFREEGLECLQLLKKLHPAGEFNYAGDVTRGLALGSWVGAQEFANIIAGCSEVSVEVFWRTPSYPRAAVSAQPWPEAVQPGAI